jgi:hypothetical protein
MPIREILKEALERLSGQGPRTDSAPDRRFHNILYYRFFRHRLQERSDSVWVLFSSEQQRTALFAMLFQRGASLRDTGAGSAGYGRSPAELVILLLSFRLHLLTNSLFCSGKMSQVKKRVEQSIPFKFLFPWKLDVLIHLCFA